MNKIGISATISHEAHSAIRDLMRSKRMKKSHVIEMAILQLAEVMGDE